MIPMLMRLKICERKENRWKGVNLWIPLFLVWILLLPLILLAVLAWAILRIAGSTSEGALNAARLMEAGVTILKNIGDLEVEVLSADTEVILHF